MTKRKIARARRICGAALAASMAATFGMLAAQGRWTEALPLHLCSVSALLAVYLSRRDSQSALDFLWYLGMAGAALALIFPAPAVSLWQAAFNASYVVTHAMAIAVPVLSMMGGMRPTRGGAFHVLTQLHALAALSFAANDVLGTDFLFLAGPPAGTPLVAVYAMGKAAYYAFLEALLLAVCGAMTCLARVIFRHKT